MSRQAYPELLIWNASSGTAFNTFTTAKTVLPPQCVYPFLATWWHKDRIVRITATGNLSNIVTTPGTITFQMMLGATIVMNSGAFQMSSTAHTNVPFKAECLVRCDVEGATAQLVGGWTVSSQALSLTAVADSTTTIATLAGPSPMALGTAFDATVAQNLDMFVGFSISGAGNQIQVFNYIVESLN